MIGRVFLGIYINKTIYRIIYLYDIYMRMTPAQGSLVRAAAAEREEHAGDVCVLY